MSVMATGSLPWGHKPPAPWELQKTLHSWRRW
jgi:hypothetical protein